MNFYNTQTKRCFNKSLEYQLVECNNLIWSSRQAVRANYTDSSTFQWILPGQHPTSNIGFAQKNIMGFNVYYSIWIRSHICLWIININHHNLYNLTEPFTFIFSNVHLKYGHYFWKITYLFSSSTVSGLVCSAFLKELSKAASRKEDLLEANAWEELSK